MHLDSNWLKLLPAIIVIIIAVLTRNVMLSLIIGIVSCSLIVTNLNIADSGILILRKLIEESQIKSIFAINTKNLPTDHIYTFSFLVVLGIIISLITYTGGMAAYTHFIEKKLKNKRAVESSSLFLSLFFFIDDYLSSLTVGCILKPITDKFKIPRAKLAFLIDTMSNPLCLLAPFSSWTAMIISNMQIAGIQDAFSIYIKAIPFMFYPIFVTTSAFFIVIRKISFGPMAEHELIAHNTNNLFGGKDPISSTEETTNNHGKITDFIVPITTFLILIVTCILYSAAWNPLKNTPDIFWALLAASTLTLLFSITYYFYRAILDFKTIAKSFYHGFNLMKSSMIILLLAWTFASMLRFDLKTGEFLAQALGHGFPAYIFPVIIFLISTITASATGSVWGTIMIMLPIAIPLLQSHPTNYINLLLPTLGGLFSGSISGSHLSLISDATIVASTSAGAHHLDHVTTQLPYIMPAFIATIAALILTGILSNQNLGIVSLILPLTSGLIITFMILFIRNRNFNNKQEKQ